MQLSPAVATALKNGEPVVALESTVITHGLDYPANADTARRMEHGVRERGATPATVGILGGEIVVGINDEQIERLATGKAARKCSVRDLAIAVAMKLDGGTTVAATMFIAAKAGIGVFATGGIGGVHRGHPFDVSADLVELSRTPVTVVCAGAKALLDLPLTFEQLETLGVPVIGYQTDEIPAFYSRSSGLRADFAAQSADEVARIVAARRAMALPGGELVCAPVPHGDELARDEAEAAIVEAQRRADAQGVHGADSTPFILGQIAQLTGGASVRANTSLLVNNARIGAEIARALLQTEG